MKWIQFFIRLITFAAWRMSRRRKFYDELKAEIVKNHQAGKGGMVVPRKFAAVALESFGPPMYTFARKDSKNGPLCIFWRKDLMTEEVGPPKPELVALVEAESRIVDSLIAKTDGSI